MVPSSENGRATDLRRPVAHFITSYHFVAVIRFFRITEFIPSCYLFRDSLTRHRCHVKESLIFIPSFLGISEIPNLLVLPVPDAVKIYDVGEGRVAGDGFDGGWGQVGLQGVHAGGDEGEVFGAEVVGLDSATELLVLPADLGAEVFDFHLSHALHFGEDFFARGGHWFQGSGFRVLSAEFIHLPTGFCETTATLTAIPLDSMEQTAVLCHFDDFSVGDDGACLLGFKLLHLLKHPLFSSLERLLVEEAHVGIRALLDSIGGCCLVEFFLCV